MSDTERLLDRIEEGIVAHGGDLGGWTLRRDDTLQLFDGRITLRASREDFDEPGAEVAHCHVFATLHEYDDEVLDACMLGMGNTREEAIDQIAGLWITGVAGPIKSFLENRPICMTCLAGAGNGDPEQGYSHGDYGLPGLRAFVGPAAARCFQGQTCTAQLDDTKPWFRFARESAAPRRIHLAKATIVSKGKEGWHRDLEIDGHDVSHHDAPWPAGIPSTEFGYLTRFAVFEFPRDSSEIAQRAELERTILHFAHNYNRHETTEQLMQAMVAQGFDPDLVHEVESLSTIAFSRTLFERSGIQYSPTIIRARRDGRVETEVPLMTLPAYTRARAIAAKLRDTMPEQEFQALCLYNAESHAIMQVIESQGDNIDLSNISLLPCVVPDREVSQETINAAMATLQALLDSKRPPKKPWWKFW